MVALVPIGMPVGNWYNMESVHTVPNSGVLEPHGGGEGSEREGEGKNDRTNTNRVSQQPV